MEKKKKKNYFCPIKWGGGGGMLIQQTLSQGMKKRDSAQNRAQEDPEHYFINK